MKKIYTLIAIITFSFLSFRLAPSILAWSTSDGNYGWTCFPAGTKILMADNQEKNIEEVKIGDQIMSYDGSKNTLSTVLELDAPIRDHLYELIFTNNTSLRLTREHPLYTSDGWKAIDPQSTLLEMPDFKVKKLSVGDRVFNRYGQYITIKTINYIPGLVKTYNLKEVSKNHNFFADSYLAHNKKNTCISCETLEGPATQNDGSVEWVRINACDYECQTNKSTNNDGSGGSAVIATTSEVGTAQTTTNTTSTTESVTAAVTQASVTPGTNDYCQGLTVSPGTIEASGTATLLSTAKTSNIIKFSYKFYNLDNVDTAGKPKPINFVSNVAYELINTFSVASNNDVLAVPFEVLDRRDFNWSFYMPKPKRIRVEVYFVDTQGKVSKKDDKCTVDFKVASIDPTPTPNINCKCTNGSCATSCFYDKHSTGATYVSPVKCNLTGIFTSDPTDSDKTKWCQSYYKTKGDANNDGKATLLDYFYYLSARSKAKIPPTINPDFSGNGYIDDADKDIIIKSLKQ